MADIVVAGPPSPSLKTVETLLANQGEKYQRIEMDITDPAFADTAGEGYPAVILSPFLEGDLTSIKAMQAIRLKNPCVQMIFIAQRELSSSILTLMFNEGAFGTLHEPISDSQAWQLIKQAIKRSKWDLDDRARSDELRKLNEKLRKKVERAEIELSRRDELIDKFERLVHFLLVDKYFKPSKLRILIVSHTPYQRHLLEEELGGIGCQVKSTDLARNALEIIKEFRPNIVVSDLELSDMSGAELSKTVKDDPSYPRNYFVVCTASPEKVDHILSPEYMVDDCVVKPSDTRKYYILAARIAMGALEP